MRVYLSIIGWILFDWSVKVCGTIKFSHFGKCGFSAIRVWRAIGSQALSVHVRVFPVLARDFFPPRGNHSENEQEQFKNQILR